MNPKSIEILAPCGTPEALRAALAAGADAVYFGVGAFNARQHAGNFDADAFQQAVALCRLHDTRIHITLNTLVHDSELPAFAQAAKRICQTGVDALILQDLGAVRLLRLLCPSQVLHASTQMSVGTDAGLRLLQTLGFSRAVLPRELSEPEIASLCETAPLELETFVHGAQCMCVSGQCLLSAMLGSRSGNRGLCAQPCRLAFAAPNGTGHDLSLKDLSLIEQIPKLAEMGVCAMKIEGRMKRPEYVTAAVTACREALSGAYTAERRQDLAALFSRSGFTDGYFQAKRGREMFGIRQKEDVTAATGALLRSYAAKAKQISPRRGVDFRFAAAVGALPTLTAVCAGHTVTVSGETKCAAAQTLPLTAQKVEAQLQKCGGTVFFAAHIETVLDGSAALPLSVLNQMRRAALAALTEALVKREPVPAAAVSLSVPPHTASAPRRWVRMRSAEQVPENTDFDRLFLPLDTDAQTLSHLGAGVYLPRGLFGTAEQIRARLCSSPAAYVLCDTLDAVALARASGKEIVGGAFLNLTNSFALEEAKQLGLSAAIVSHELTAAQIADLGGSLPRGACVYGRTPLMLTRNCPIRNGQSCNTCKRQSVLRDRKGVSFPVRCENGYAEIFNSRPTYMADRLSEIRNVDFHFYDFTIETREDCAAILEAYRSGKKPVGEYTRGFFYRGVE